MHYQNKSRVRIKILWEEIQSSKLDEKGIWGIFLDAPMITITKEEDDKLNKLRLKTSPDRNRYEIAGINIIVLESSPSRTLK